MKFTASIAALILLQGFAIALPREPGVQVVGENRLPLTYPKAKAPHKGGACKPHRPTPVTPDVPKNSTLPGTEPGTEPGIPPGTQPDPKPQPSNNPVNPPKPSPSSDAGEKDPGPEIDDYPDKNRCDKSDKNGLTTCQCTAFVGWRVTERLSVTNFTSYGGQRGWGDANRWGDVAEQGGLVVDKNPAPGAVAWTRAGTYGHVAWVHAVEGDQIEMEDYNGLGGDRQYGRGKRSAADFEYIHF